MQPVHIRVLEKKEGEPYASFSLYIPAGDGYVTEYRFLYVQCEKNPALSYEEGPNDPANSALYRIREAYVGRMKDGEFSPLFRALQGGEIAFALRETGAGDFVGGYHGDEVLSEVFLMADGKPVSLLTPGFFSATEVTFAQDSVVFRCNTPDTPLLCHRQSYTVRGESLLAAHSLLWLTDSYPLQAAFLPMLTAQRLDPAEPSRILTDTVEFLDVPGGRVVAIGDTTPYGLEKTEADPPAPRAVASAVRVLGRASGLVAEAGIIPHTPLPGGQVEMHVWPRFGHDYDSKIYFEIGGKTAPKKGTLLEADVYYRLTYRP
ncbi:MAG: hypothetical protein J6T24_03290 [Clostridia bacterium]|nr:hypothetical protein [Clostridia bacterium]